MNTDNTDPTATDTTANTAATAPDAAPSTPATAPAAVPAKKTSKPKAKPTKTPAKAKPTKKPATASAKKTTKPAPTKSDRVEYGFELNFPNTPFTMHQLENRKRGVKYITLYMRVKKALEKGVLKEVGTKEPSVSRKGRKEIIYSRVDASATTAAVDAAIAASSPASAS